MISSLALALLLAQPVPQTVRGPTGPINLIIGAGVSQSGMTLTISGGGGGGGTPGGVNGNIQINNAGAFGAYAGATCTGANLVQALNANGAATCYQLKLNQIANPNGDATFTFPSGGKLLYTFTGSTDVAFSIDGDGAFTGTGDLVHIHKSGTGSSTGADALHVEVTTDPNMTGIRVTMPGSTNDAINTNGKITAPTFVGALTGNASTATALSTAGSANQFWKNGNVWAQPDWADLSGKPATFPATVPVATATALAADPSDCGANQYATTIAASGNLTCAQVGYGQISGTPTIPADISGAPFVTTAASGLLSAEAVLPTCGGTDKLTFNGTTISCAADVGGTYTLPAATASVLGGVKGTGSLLVCSGTDKATGFAADGTLQCAADQTGGAGSVDLRGFVTAFGGF